MYFCITTIKRYNYRKNQSYRTDRPATSAIGGWLSQWQEPRIPYALPRNTLEITGVEINRSRIADGDDTHIRQCMGETLRSRRNNRVGNATRAWAQTNNGLFGRRCCTQGHRAGQAKHEESQGGVGAGIRQEGEREHVQSFFISIGARYRRIRKRPKGKPSPQLYEYKTEKLQELDSQAKDGLIDLYFADESHICTEGYVPYGWQFRGEDVFIPSQRGYRLNIFGMIDRNNRYEGFSTNESITADKVADFLGRM